MLEPREEGLGDRRQDGRRGCGDSGLGLDSECGEHCEAWRQGDLLVCLGRCWEADVVGTGLCVECHQTETCNTPVWSVSP